MQLPPKAVLTLSPPLSPLQCAYYTALVNTRPSSSRTEVSFLNRVLLEMRLLCDHPFLLLTHLVRKLKSKFNLKNRTIALYLLESLKQLLAEPDSSSTPGFTFASGPYTLQQLQQCAFPEQDEVAEAVKEKLDDALSEQGRTLTVWLVSWLCPCGHSSFLFVFSARLVCSLKVKLIEYLQSCSASSSPSSSSAADAPACVPVSSAAVSSNTSTTVLLDYFLNSIDVNTIVHTSSKMGLLDKLLSKLHKMGTPILWPLLFGLSLILSFAFSQDLECCYFLNSLECWM